MMDTYEPKMLSCKVGLVLKRQGEVLKSSNRPNKIIPLFIDDENRKIERGLVLKSYDVFTNEINSNYTNQYMKTLFGLLFNNEHRYYIKRNKLKVDGSKSRTKTNDKKKKRKIKIDKDESYIKSRGYETSRVPKNPYLGCYVSEEIPNTMTSRRAQGHSLITTPRKSKHTLSATNTPSNTPRMNQKFFNKILEKDKLLNLIYSTNKLFEEEKETKKARMSMKIEKLKKKKEARPCHLNNTNFTFFPKMRRIYQKKYDLY